MLTIVLLSQKGGAGKTTLALGLAVESQTMRGATVVADIDPQGSAAAWGDIRGNDYPVVMATQANRLRKIQETARGNNVECLIVDTAAQVANDALTAAEAADLIVIPCTPSGQDLGAIARTVQLARLAGRPTIVVLNRAPVRNPLVASATEALKHYGVQTCPIIIYHRIDHVHAYPAGRTAAETAPKGKAADELRQLEIWIQRNHAKARPPR